MNILLTGGAGYIGSHTALTLRKAGFTPIVLDNLVHGHRGAVKYGPFVQGEVGDEAVVRRLCEDYKPAALIHLAALIEAGESVGQEERYRENNFHQASRLFDTVLACGVKRVVFSSTAAVYGAPESEDPLREDCPLRPLNPYGDSKAAAELYVRALPLKSVSLRYFNAAGAAPEEGLGEAHEPETHLIPNAIKAGLGCGDKVQIFGTDYPTPDGTAIRDYVHVMDLAGAHVAALRYLLGGGGTEICNLGTGSGSSVREVLNAVGQSLGRSVPQTLAPRRAGDSPRLVADTTRAYATLGWKPRHALASMIETAAAWHRQGQRLITD